MSSIRYQGFECCPDDKDESRSVSRVVSHIKVLHLCSEKQKTALQNVTESDYVLFVALDESLRVVEQ